MSVLLECQPGDEIVCIQEFHASPDGNGFAWETSRQFSVGERLRFVGSRLDAHNKQRPNGWLIIFEASDKERYAATQTHFVTEECWENIKAFFAQRVMREPRRRKAGRGS